MGSSFDNWDAVEGAYYMGAGTSWEGIWTMVALAICVIALVKGSMHERNAYKKVAKK